MRRGREPASWVPTRRVVRHLAELRAAGMTLSAIAVRAGVGRATLYRVRQRGTRVSRIVERKVLAVDVVERAATWTVEPAELVAHLDELRAAGTGGLRKLAAAGGVSRRTLMRARRGQRVRAELVARMLDVGPPPRSPAVAVGGGYRSGGAPSSGFPTGSEAHHGATAGVRGGAGR